MKMLTILSLVVMCSTGFAKKESNPYSEMSCENTLIYLSKDNAKAYTALLMKPGLSEDAKEVVRATIKAIQADDALLMERANEICGIK